MTVQRRGERLTDRPGLTIEQQIDGSTTIVIVTGELDILRAPRLTIALGDALRALPQTLVLDLCEVEFVDSTGLAALMNARRRAVRAGIEMRLACDVESTLKLLTLTRLDGEFDVHPTRAHAVGRSFPPDVTG